MHRRSTASVHRLLALPLLASVLAMAACGKQEAPAPEASSADATPPAEAAPQAAQTAPPPASAGAAASGEQAAAPAGPAQPIPKIEPIKPTPQLVEEGKKLYTSVGCNACHGSGGGGMCPPLTNDIWVYGSDDSTLHALIKEGSAAMQDKHGLKRVGVEKVVGIMPPFGSLLSDDEINKVLAFIHSVSPSAGKGEPQKPAGAGAGGQ